MCVRHIRQQLWRWYLCMWAWPMVTEYGNIFSICTELKAFVLTLSYTRLSFSLLMQLRTAYLIPNMCTASGSSQHMCTAVHIPRHTNACPWIYMISLPHALCVLMYAYLHYVPALTQSIPSLSSTVNSQSGKLAPMDL